MKTIQTGRNEEGYVLVAALVTLLLLTVLGIWAGRTTSMDLHMTANERLHQEAFYQADAATHLAERLILHDWNCFNALAADDEIFKDEELTFELAPDSRKFPGTLYFKEDKPNSLRMAEHVPLNTTGDDDWEKYEPSDDVKSFRYCLASKNSEECSKMKRSDGAGYTNVLVGSLQKKLPGAGGLFDAARDGKGISAGNMSVYVQYVIKTHHVGRNNSESRVTTAWQWLCDNCEFAQPKEDCHYIDL